MRLYKSTLWPENETVLAIMMLQGKEKQYVGILFLAHFANDVFVIKQMTRNAPRLRLQILKKRIFFFSLLG